MMDLTLVLAMDFKYPCGEDLREKPYSLFRIAVDAQPVRLNRT